MHLRFSSAAAPTLPPVAATFAAASFHLGALNIPRSRFAKSSSGRAATESAPSFAVEVANTPVTVAAARLEGTVAQAWLEAVQLVQSQIPVGKLREACASGNASSVLELMDLENRFERALWGAGFTPESFTFLEALDRIYMTAAQEEIRQLADVPVMKSFSEIGKAIDRRNLVGVQLAFDARLPEAEAKIRETHFTLIREMARDTKAVVRDAVLRGFVEGRAPDVMARDMRAKIGLTSRQSAAVDNFRRMLEQSKVRAGALHEALTRELRDHRFDATLRAALAGRTVLAQPQIDTMVQRYHERYLKYRSEAIARTETIRAAVRGQAEVWNQSVRQGLLDPARTRRKWIIAGMTMSCESCKSVPKMNPNGVALREPFKTPDGPVDGPPLHPHCRCAVSLVFLPVFPAGAPRAPKMPAVPAAVEPEVADWEQLRPSEEYLQNMAVTSESPHGGGVADTRLVVFKDGAKAIFKPDSGEPKRNLRRNITRGFQSEREVGAWTVAKIAGADDLVAPSVTRTVGKQRGLVMEWQEGVVAYRMSVDPFDGLKDLARAAVFDFVIGNEDRHGGNWLVNAGKLRLIDHTLAFPDAGDYGRVPGNHRFLDRAQSGKLPGYYLQSAANAYLGKQAAIVAALRKVGLPEASIRGVMKRLKTLSRATGWTDLV